MKGFTLIELMIVVAIIAIIAAIAIPNLLESKKAANEAAAISALRTLSSAQELYNTRYATYGDLSDLDTAGMIDSVLGNAETSAKSGYIFNCTASSSAWCCYCEPETWDVTGTRNFMIDQTGVIYYTTADNDIPTTADSALGS